MPCVLGEHVLISLPTYSDNEFQVLLVPHACSGTGLAQDRVTGMLGWCSFVNMHICSKWKFVDATACYSYIMDIWGASLMHPSGHDVTDLCHVVS